MSTTTGQIKKIKKELQKLRSEYLRAADAQEQHRIAIRIKAHKELLEMLGG